MFDWSGKNGDKSGKSQGILIYCVSGNPVKVFLEVYYDLSQVYNYMMICMTEPWVCIYGVFIKSLCMSQRLLVLQRILSFFSYY